MQTINTQDIQAVFVNTDKRPISVERLDCYRYTRIFDQNEGCPMYRFYQLVKKSYQHPDTEYCHIYILDWEEIRTYNEKNLIALIDMMSEVKNTIR